MESLEFVTNHKGNPTLIYKGYEYNNTRKTPAGVKHWRCKKYKSCQCKAILHTKEKKIVKEPSEHSHDKNDCNAALEARKLVNEMIEITKSGASISGVIDNSLSEISEDVQKALPKKHTLVRRLYRERQKLDNIPPIPKDFNFEIPNKYLEWVLYDSGEDDSSRIIIFGHEDLLRLLADHDCWLTDSTFKVVPEMLFQLYTIHVQLDNYLAVPCVLALLPDKTQGTYSKLLTEINKLVPTANPKKVILDFEIEERQSFKVAYPNVEISGCYFHLNQWMIRKVTSLELKNLYETDAEFAVCTKILCTLALLPEDEILEGFFDIIELFDTLGYKNNQYIQELLSSFEIKFIRGHKLKSGKHQIPIFSIESWNHNNAPLTSVARACNAVEGWHYGLQSILQCARPTIWKTFDGLNSEIIRQHSYYMQYCSGQWKPAKTKYRMLAEKLVKMVTDYKPEDRLDTLRRIAHMV